MTTRSIAVAIALVGVMVYAAATLLAPHPRKAVPPPNDPEELIVGTWQSDQDPKVTWIFSEEGELMRYYDSELLGTDPYAVVEECGGEVASAAPEDVGLLRVTWNNEREFCYAIQTLTADQLTLLALSGTGRIFTYRRVE